MASLASFERDAVTTRWDPRCGATITPRSSGVGGPMVADTPLPPPLPNSSLRDGTAPDGVLRPDRVSKELEVETFDRAAGLEPAFEDLSRGVLPDPNPDDCHIAPPPHVCWARGAAGMFKGLFGTRNEFFARVSPKAHERRPRITRGASTTPDAAPFETSTEHAHHAPTSRRRLTARPSGVVGNRGRAASRSHRAPTVGPRPSGAASRCASRSATDAPCSRRVGR